MPAVMFASAVVVSPRVSPRVWPLASPGLRAFVCADSVRLISDLARGPPCCHVLRAGEGFRASAKRLNPQSALAHKN